MALVSVALLFPAGLVWGADDKDGDKKAAALQKELERARTEIEDLKQKLKREAARNAVLLKEAQAQRDRAVAMEIQAQALKNKVEQLTTQVQDLVKEVARLRTKGGAAAPAKNPAPEDVEGIVKTVAAGGGLVTISVGSDAGLAAGHTLEVFRLGKTPKYLGTIRIVSVKAKEAVGKPVGRLLGSIEKGDNVASKVKGK
jgi:hypothetical protein